MGNHGCYLLVSQSSLRTDSSSAEFWDNCSAAMMGLYGLTKSWGHTQPCQNGGCLVDIICEHLALRCSKFLLYTAFASQFTSLAVYPPCSCRTNVTHIHITEVSTLLTKANMARKFPIKTTRCPHLWLHLDGVIV